MKRKLLVLAVITVSLLVPNVVLAAEPELRFTGIPTVSDNSPSGGYVGYKKSVSINIKTTDTDVVSSVTVTGPKGYLENGGSFTGTAQNNKTLETKVGGNYIFEIRDLKGNTHRVEKYIAYVDGVAPEMTSNIEYHASRSQADIVVTSSDIGTSGVKSVACYYPNGTIIQDVVTSRFRLRVSKNGNYSFIITDNNGNISKKIEVPVTGIAQTSYTTTFATIQTGASGGGWANVKQVELVAQTDVYLPAAQNVGQVVFRTNSDGITLLQIDSDVLPAGTTSKTYALNLAADSAKTFTVVVKASDGTVETHRLNLKSSESEATLSITNKSTVEGSVFGRVGYLSYGSFKMYPEENNQKGISIQLQLQDMNFGQFMSGIATINSASFPIVWHSNNHSLVKNENANLTGVIFIPATSLVDLDNVTINIKAYSQNSETDSASKRETATASIRLTTDIKSPVITVSKVPESASFKAYANDASRVEKIEYTLDGIKWAVYTKPVAVEKGKRHSVTVRATDSLGNIANVTEEIEFSNTGGSGNTDITQTIDGSSIYVIRTRISNQYIINGHSGGKEPVPMSNLKFAGTP